MKTAPAMLSLVPQMPPAVCGVADYATLLAGKLAEMHGVRTHFVSASPMSPCLGGDWSAEHLRQRSAAALQDLLRTGAAGFDTVLLHQSGYGYHSRGVPLWLVKGLGQLKRLSGKRLITMFHELYASGPVTSSAFWTRPLQKWVARQLARLSDEVRTNLKSNAAELQRLAGISQPAVTVMPVFSNLGELAAPAPLQQRPNDMVMFCSGVHLGESPSQTMRMVNAVAARFDVATVHLVGKNRPHEAALLERETVHHPFLAAAEVSRLLQSCRLAFNGYPVQYLGKSGIFGAYAAHGLAILSPGGNAPDMLPDGVAFGRELLRADDDQLMARLGPEALQAAATASWSWYQGHNLSRTADSYFSQASAPARS